MKKLTIILMAFSFFLGGCASGGLYNTGAQSGVSDKTTGDTLTGAEFTAVKNTADTADALATVNEAFIATIESIDGLVKCNGIGNCTAATGYTDYLRSTDLDSEAELESLVGVTYYTEAEIDASLALKLDSSIGGEQQATMSDGYLEVIDGFAFRVITTTDGHTTKFQVYDTNGTTWRDILTFENGDSSDSDVNNYPRVHLGANTAMTGLGNMAVGMRPGSEITTNTVLTYEGVNHTYLVSAAVTVTLPDVGTAADDAQYGDWVKLRVLDASEVLTIDCDAADKINRQGTAQAAGVDVDTPGNAGDHVTCEAATNVDGAGTDGWFCDSNVTLAAGS